MRNFTNVTYETADKVYIHSKHVKAGHYRLASETPFKWRFAGGQKVARICMLVAFIFIFSLSSMIVQLDLEGMIFPELMRQILKAFREDTITRFVGRAFY